MDVKKEMIIIDNQFVRNISSCIFYSKENKYIIKYDNNNSLYFFSKARVKYLTNPTMVSPDDYAFYLNGKLLENLKEIYKFNYYNDHYYRMFFRDNSYLDFEDNEIKKIRKNFPT